MDKLLVLVLGLFLIFSGDLEFQSGKNHDFGRIRMNAEVSHDFEFTNKGKQIIKILNVTTTCGCTVVDYPKEIKPGASAVITAGYAAGSVPGVFKKYITVFTSGQEEFVKLTVKGEITF